MSPSFHLCCPGEADGLVVGGEVGHDAHAVVERSQARGVEQRPRHVVRVLQVQPRPQLRQPGLLVDGRALGKLQLARPARGVHVRRVLGVLGGHARDLEAAHGGRGAAIVPGGYTRDWLAGGVGDPALPHPVDQLRVPGRGPAAAGTGVGRCGGGGQGQYIIVCEADL